MNQQNYGMPKINPDKIVGLLKIKMLRVCLKIKCDKKEAEFNIFVFGAKLLYI